MKRKKIIALFLLLFTLAACGGAPTTDQSPNIPQNHVANYQPATEVLAEGDTLKCPFFGNLAIEKINENTVEGKLQCAQRNNSTNEIEVGSELDFTAPKTDEVFALASYARNNWGIVVNDGSLVQVFQMHSSYPGKVLLLWPPPKTSE